MESMIRRAAEKAIDYVVPLACGAAILWMDKLPMEVKEAAPLGIIALVALNSAFVSGRNRTELKRLKAIHERADTVNDLMFKAMRASLDDDMGKLYAYCCQKGYTTEDERRRYDRMEKAYEAIDGNGEAKRRAVHFFALQTEEEWRAHS